MVEIFWHEEEGKGIPIATDLADLPIVTSKAKGVHTTGNVHVIPGACIIPLRGDPGSVSSNSRANRTERRDDVEESLENELWKRTDERDSEIAELKHELNKIKDLLHHHAGKSPTAKLNGDDSSDVMESKSNDALERFKTEMESKFATMESQLSDLKKIKHSDSSSSSKVHAKSPSFLQQNSERYHPNDTYSFWIASQYCSASYIFAVAIWVIQILIFVLVLQTQLEWDEESTNMLKVPINVTAPVRTVQIVSILIAIFVEDDIRIAVEQCQESYTDLQNGQENFRYATPTKWKLSYAARSISSLFGLTAIFVLIIQESNVFDLLLNFTGLEFVSQLDNIAFVLCSNGFFGIELQATAEEVQNKTYKIPTNNSRKQYVRGFLLAIILVIMYAIYSVIWARQLSGRYACKKVLVEFNSPVFPSIGTFSGTYELAEDVYNARSVYVSTAINVDGNSKRATFFNDKINDSNHWQFGVCAEDQVGTCSSQTILQSQGDKVGDSFDIRDATDEFWEVSESENSLLQDVEVYCLQQSDTSTSEANCDGKALLCENACPQMTIQGSAFFPDRNRTRGSVYTILSHQGSVSTAYDHPIYYSQFEANDVIDLVLFTGQRWVLTDSNQFIGWNATGDTDAIGSLAKFFRNDFNALQLRRTGSIAYLSDEVDITWSSSMLPERLRWYAALYPSVNEKYGNIDWFPSVDPSSPIDVLFACSFCNNASNPCKYNGICNEGVCSCRNEAKGSMCEIPPVGNGRCDPYFNYKDFDYDGGDCCGATCEGETCPAELDTAMGMEKGWLFLGRPIATGYGFPECRDPSMVPITIVSSSGIELYGGLEIICDNKVHFTMRADILRYEVMETVYVNDGARCEVQFSDMYTVGWGRLNIIYNVGSEYEYKILQIDLADIETINWSSQFSVVSKCLLSEVLDFQTLDELELHYSPTAQALFWMNQFVAEGTICGSDVFKQQYAMALLSHSGWFEPSRHCEWGSFVTCKQDQRISEISLDGRLSSTLVSEIGFLLDLEELQMLPSLGASVSGSSIPTEIGLLTKLCKQSSSIIS